VRGVFRKGHDRSRFSTGMRKVLKYLLPFVLDLEMNKWIEPRWRDAWVSK
jgi:hypothetical protein